MAKRKSKKKGFALSLPLLVALVCALVAVVAYFLPFQVITSDTIITDESKSTVNGVDFTQSLFEGVDENVKEANKDNKEFKSLRFWSVICYISAFCCIVLGALLLLGLLGSIVVKNKMLQNACKAIAALSVIVSLLGLIGGFIFAGKISGDITIVLDLASSKATVGIGAYLYTLASIVGAGSLLVLKK